MPVREDARSATRNPRTGGFAQISGDEVTTIIPVDEYDPAFADLAYSRWEQASAPYSAVIDASALTSTEGYRPTHSEITQDILIPESEFDDDLATSTHRGSLRTTPDVPEIPAYVADDDYDAVGEPKPFRTKTPSPRRGSGKHRVSAPPTALKGGRAALVAIAAGAAVAAATQITANHDDNVAATTAPVDPAAGTVVDQGPGVAPAASSADMSNFTKQLAVGKQIAAAEQARENLARRPMFMSPIPLGAYQFTSCFCDRWGSFHGGIDMAAPLGTPIHAASDGVVIASGPASGYGNWIQIRGADGTVTMYGHMATAGLLVQKGQHVTAGDVIALVGSEGFSTGPHLHFEVWKNGTTKIDPMPWLAQHGVRLSAYTG
ncbi:M23 family metallopeptidase [Gordonia sp. TBRC 11910]|uniref:M23 family metallopeptidase n=1 Tax=Gordonia asplenii TaxID=2725283 RepID=A0A848KWG1_9ACTN|nr:M23 family metallopeptidase [Gordonia asplenii]NMO00501.1 M23 family metallopeptidase [Gordonia asplenii]